LGVDISGAASPNHPADPRSELQEQRGEYEGKELGGSH
jgi:hypothetical protein